LNTNLFDGRSAYLAEVRAIADTLPFLSARRVVIIDGWLTRLLKRAEPADDGDEPAANDGADDDSKRGGSSAREQLAALADYLPTCPNRPRWCW